MEAKGKAEAGGEKDVEAAPLQSGTLGRRLAFHVRLLLLGLWRPSVCLFVLFVRSAVGLLVCGAVGDLGAPGAPIPRRAIKAAAPQARCGGPSISAPVPAGLGCIGGHLLLLGGRKACRPSAVQAVESVGSAQMSRVSRAIRARGEGAARRPEGRASLS